MSEGCEPLRGYGGKLHWKIINYVQKFYDWRCDLIYFGDN